MRNNPMSEARRQHLHGPLVPQHGKAKPIEAWAILIVFIGSIALSAWRIFA